MTAKSAPRYALALYMAGLLMVGGYFALASVQGDFGLFRRVEIQADISELTALRDSLSAEVAMMTNKTRRLSDTYLDLDLLDEQAREVLGLVRMDEIVIN
jgi:cell division protein FtsB